MKPVKQTTFGYPHGNCMAACVASLLEIPLARMPVIPADGNFNRVWDEWLEARGFARICFRTDGAFIPKGYYLMAGPSPREIYDENGNRVFHVVVALDGKPVHDPHPDDTFLLSISEVEIIYPVDPSHAMFAERHLRSEPCLDCDRGRCTMNCGPCLPAKEVAR